MSKLKDYLRKATDIHVQSVEKELWEKDNQIEEYLAELRLMIKEHDDEILRSWRFEDEFLVRFIRGRKYNLDSALEKLLNNVHCKRIWYPDVFMRLYPSALRECLEKKSMRVLKHRDRLGRHVCVFDPSTFDPDTTDIEDMMRVQIMVAWEMMSFKQTQLNGIVVVCDGAGFSRHQIKALTPGHIQKMLAMTLKCCPTRFKGCHILNLPKVMYLTVQVFRPLLPSKVYNRLFVHGRNLNVFHKMIPTDILPEWIGGKLCEEDACDIALENAIMGKDDYYKDLIQ